MMFGTYIPGWMELVFWFVIAGIFLLVEVYTPSFFLIWFSFGAVLAGLLALIGIPEFIQVPVFLISSTILVIFARPIVRKFVDKNQDPIPSNVYNLIGVKAIVLKSVNQMSGKVKIMNTGEIWSAYTYEHFEPIEENTQVIIKEVDGAKLVVVPRSSEKTQ